MLFPTLTPAQQAASQIVSIAQQQFNQLALSGQRGWNLIWNNNNATPADVIAALGTSAGALLALANLNITTIASAATIAGTAVPTIPGVPDGYTYTINSDGSVTLTGTPTA